MSTEYSKKFKNNSKQLAANLVALIKKFRKEGHIEISDVQLDIVLEYVNDQDELDAVSVFASKLFGGEQSSVVTKIQSIIKRDETYFREHVSGIMPSSGSSIPSAVLEAVKILTDRFAYLISANTTHKDEKGNPIPLVKKETKAVIWKYVDALTRDAIEHFYTTNAVIDEVDKDKVFAEIRPPFMTHLEKSKSK